MFAILKAYALVQVAKLMTFMVSAVMGLLDNICSYQKNSVPIDTESDKSIRYVLYGSITCNRGQEREITAQLNHYLTNVRNELDSFNATGLYDYFSLNDNDTVTMVARKSDNTMLTMVVPMNRDIPWQIDGTQINTPRFGCIENCI